MSERKPWLPDASRILQILELMAQPARECGMECIAQFYAAVPEALDGWETLSCGPLRYTPEMALRDLRELPEGGTVCYVIRHADPETEEGAGCIAFHEKARKLERESLGGDA